LKIGVFGGTFNPPHTGHIQSAKTASKQLGLDLLMVIPAGIPPHKALSENAPPPEVRLEMTRLSFHSLPDTIISDIEISGTTPSYSINTISMIKRHYSSADVYLLVGTDMYLSLETWKESEKLLKAVRPAVFIRNPADKDLISEYSRRLLNNFGVHTNTIDNDVVDISSSQLRDMLPKREGVRYIDDTTYGYIIKNRIYGAKPDWDWLRDRAYSMLDPSRIPHVNGCEQEALLLAKRWGVDPDDAREAAILHDITKILSLQENLLILKDHGIQIPKLEKNEEKLLHSKTGALLAKSLFGVSENVANAIMWHTTGRAGMSPLEKVIYIADYIEPERDFPGVEDLRKAAYEDLDKALTIGFETSIQDMNNRGIIPDESTFNALQDIKKQIQKGQTYEIIRQ